MSNKELPEHYEDHDFTADDLRLLLEIRREVGDKKKDDA